jgi:4'-phosphopantetheinyl transferase
LSAGEVHLWYGDPAELAADEAIADCRRLLSAAELATCARFAKERDRQLYLAAHALLRRALSYAVPIDPQQWQFSVRRGGKPVLAGPVPEASLHFNLSHTPGLVACAISREFEIGVDVESIERRIDLAALAQRFFSPAEAAELLSFPAAGRQQRFHRYWTLKEAYIKAIGAGLAMPLHSFTMRLPVADTAAESQPARQSHEPLPESTIQFNSSLSEQSPAREDPNAWQFAQYFPTPGHVLAVAIHRPASPPQRIIIRRANQAFVTHGIWNENQSPE